MFPDPPYFQVSRGNRLISGKAECFSSVFSTPHRLAQLAPLVIAMRWNSKASVHRIYHSLITTRVVHIDFTTGNTNCRIGMHFLIHHQGWINDERIAVRCLEYWVRMYCNNSYFTVVNHFWMILCWACDHLAHPYLGHIASSLETGLECSNSPTLLKSQRS